MGPCFGERCRQAGGLRIVEENHIPGPDEADHTFGVSVSHLGIVDRLAGTEATPVTRRSVQTIVDPLSNDKELRVATHDQPVHVKSRIERVANEHLEHFGHPSAFGRRTDVPDRPPPQFLACHARGTREIPIAFSPDERF
jgi:hypothetical protein